MTDPAALAGMDALAAILRRQNPGLDFVVTPSPVRRQVKRQNLPRPDDPGAAVDGGTAGVATVDVDGLDHRGEDFPPLRGGE